MDSHWGLKARLLPTYNQGMELNPEGGGARIIETRNIDIASHNYKPEYVAGLLNR